MLNQAKLQSDALASLSLSLSLSCLFTTASPRVLLNNRPRSPIQALKAAYPILHTRTNLHWTQPEGLRGSLCAPDIEDSRGWMQQAVNRSIFLGHSILGRLLMELLCSALSLSLSLSLALSYSLSSPASDPLSLCLGLPVRKQRELEAVSSSLPPLSCLHTANRL